MQFLKNSCDHLRSFSSINLYKSSKLLSSYFKSGRIIEAEKLFDEMPQRNTVVWSIVIHGYAINGYHEKSIKSYSQMRESGLVPNSFTVVGLLVCTVSAGSISMMLAMSVHGLILKTGFGSNSIVSTALVDTYAKCGNVLDSCKVFKKLVNPSLASYSAVICGFVHNGLYEEGVLLFVDFRKFGLVPNVAIMLTLVRGCASLERRDLVESIHGLIIKLGLDAFIPVNNAILLMYSSLKDLSAAFRVFVGMECKDIISWTTVMGLLVSLERGHDVLMLFPKMRKAGIDLDPVALMHLISASASLGDLKTGRQIHAQAIVCGFASNVSLANSIVAMYSKCGEFDSSNFVFDQTTKKNLVSWTAIISAYVQNGLTKEALNLIINARQENFSYDSVMLVCVLTVSGELAALDFTQQFHCYVIEAGFCQHRSVLTTLVSAYSKCGNADLAHIVFKEMGHLRNAISWNAIINGYGINGHGETAVALYHEMRKGEEDPDSATYLSVLSACSHSGLVKAGLMIFSQMIEEEKIRPSCEHYGCVIDLLVRAGCLSDANDSISKGWVEIHQNVWKALLSGCALHDNVELVEFAAKQISEQEPEESDHLMVLSNVYASVGRFQDAEVLRSSMQKKGLIKSLGTSCLKGNLFFSG